jgi:hypothetical protein
LPSTMNTATGAMNKSQSETDLTLGAHDTNCTPPNITTRFKRKHNNDFAADLEQFKKEMTAVMTSLMQTQLVEIQKNTQTLSEIKESNRNIETSIEFLTAENEATNNKIQRLEKQSTEDKKQINLLENKVEEVLKHSRRTNFEIKNVPKLGNETKDELINIVTNLSKTIDCPLTKTDIKDVYRTRGKPGGPQSTPIIVETSSIILKNDVLKLCKLFNAKHSEKLRAKHLGLRSMEDTPVYVAEQLTPKAARLYFLARELKRQHEYKYCWTAYGNIYMKKHDNAKVIQILNEDQISLLSKEK